VDDDFTPATPGWGVTAFADIPAALAIAASGDIVNIHSGNYAGEIGITLAVTLRAVPGENPVILGGAMRSGTGITVNSTGVALDGLIIKDFNTGIQNTAAGECQVTHCQVYDNLVYGIENLNASYIIPADLCYWGSSSGPLDNSDDRPAGLYNPMGLGNAVTDLVGYYPWSVSQALDAQPVEFGIYNTACAELEVRVKPLTDITASSLTMLVFTVRWPANTVGLTGISSPVFFLVLQQLALDVNGYNYAVFGSDNLSPADWTAGTEVPVLVFNLDEYGSGFADFEIVLDDWTLANNANPYIEVMGTDYSGFTYHSAEDVYLSSCDHPEVQAKIFLKGPYNASTDLMDTELTPDIPLVQPYVYPPFSYFGSEQLAAVPAGMVDWVLVELRSNAAGPAIDRSAAVLMQDGAIMDTNLSDFVRFNDIVPLQNYYIVVYHRNSLPVMSAGPVEVPNTELYDFPDTLNYPSYGYAKRAQIELEPGVYGLISGDINNDGKVKYSGNLNDRALILNRIYYVTGSPVLTQTIEGYYWEDLTMDDIVKYSGPGNDQREIILNLNSLTGSSALTTIYPCVVPGFPATPPDNQGGKSPLTDLADIGLFEASGQDELVVKIRPEGNITNLPVTNIQFTLSWPETSSVYLVWPTANPVNATFNIQAQGDVTISNGYKHQIFAAVSGTYVNWTAGQEYPVFYARYFYTTPDCSEFELSNDTWTQANNGEYYFEVLGDDRTGIRYQSLLTITSEGGWVDGGQEVCLGYSTGIMVLKDYSGTVTTWQKKLDAGGWTDIPGTAELTSYAEIPGSTGTWQYRAVVEKFGCTADYADPAVFTVVGKVIWTGNVDGQWNDAGNWNACGIPSITTDVIIPFVTPKPYPYVTVNGYCKTIDIKPGATVTVSITGSVTVGSMTTDYGFGGQSSGIETKISGNDP
jgi:hypothetical protein